MHIRFVLQWLNQVRIKLSLYRLQALGLICNHFGFIQRIVYLDEEVQTLRRIYKIEALRQKIYHDHFNAY